MTSLSRNCIFFLLGFVSYSLIHTTPSLRAKFAESSSSNSLVRRLNFPPTSSSSKLKKECNPNITGGDASNNNKVLVQKLDALKKEYDTLFSQLEAKKKEIENVDCGGVVEEDVDSMMVNMSSLKTTIFESSSSLVEALVTASSSLIGGATTDPPPATTSPSSSSSSSSDATNSSSASAFASSSDSKIRPQRLLLLPANVTFNEQHNLLDETRICRLEDPTPTYGQPPLDLAQSIFRGMGLTFRFQCDGPHYNNFTDQRLIPLIQRKQKESPTFGTRPTIVPLVHQRNSNNPSTSSTTRSLNILVLGNSHMRQIIVTMMCQYRDQYLGTKLFAPYSKDMDLVSRQVIFSLGPTANLTLTVLANHPAVYSTRWQDNLEEFIGHPLEDLDAIVLGQFNPFGEQYRETKLWRGAFNYSANYPKHQVDLERVSAAIDVEDVFHAFSGPIVYMSSMAKYNAGPFNRGAAHLGKLAKQNNIRNNVHAINARKHLEEPEIHNHDCTSDNQKAIGDCEKRGPHSHRCAGKKGGEPDLVAYELVQTLWKIFSTND